ncbi:MAG: hypothetical protein PHI24_08125 [Desulfitobacteriaceae bacterium]|nr:hypothetical protein [Desulfitobacteriaceae bacterium]
MDIAKLVRDQQDKNAMLRSSLELNIQLYTDNAHFIYELLQNAEDVEATVIRFHQMDDCLEVYHNGIPFSLDNLISLCNIGASDKTENLNQIGEFGVGFKSVFGICERVLLYSMPCNYNNAPEALPAFGQEIKEFTDPYNITAEPIPEPYTTKFVFPYCVGKRFSGFKTVDALKTAIAKRLRNLEATTLLFMRHLSSIEYKIDCEGNDGSGSYSLSEEKINSFCSIITAMGSTNANEELSYLRYSKEIDSSVMNSDRTVDIAYPFVIEKDGGYRFEEATNPNISVYFPTETESKIPLIVQGPYRTTPDRGSIPFDDEENIRLAELTADLLYESVLDIKAQGLISLQLLNILPFREPRHVENWLFKPLYDKMFELFKNEAILPTAEGGFVTGGLAKFARGHELISILPGDLLGELINHKNYAINDGENDEIAEAATRLSYIPYKWLPGNLTEDNQELRDLRSFLKDELGIKVIQQVDLRDYLNNNENFLKKRDDVWLELFYKYLEKKVNPNRYEGRNMLLTPFVKTADDRFVAPFRGSHSNLLPNVFMPKKNLVEGFHFVHPYFAEQCKSFFVGVLRLTEPDPYVYFIKQISRRYTGIFTGLKVTDEDYIEDVKSAVKYLKDNKFSKELQDVLSKLYFIRCDNDKGTEFVNPKNRNVYFERSEEGVSAKVYFVSDNWVRFVDMEFYSENGIDRESLRLLGVKGALRTGLNKRDWYSPREADTHRNTLCWDVGDFRSQLDFVGIDSTLTFIQNNPESDNAKEMSNIIMQLLFASEKHLSGEIILGKTNPQPKRQEADALIIDVLTYGREPWYRHTRQPKWLFDKSGRSVNPMEISKYDLDTDIYGNLKRDSNIYNILKMKISLMEETKELLACMIEQDEHSKDSKIDQLLSFLNKYKADAKGYGNMNDMEEEYFDQDAENWEHEFPSRPVRNLEKLRKSIEGQYFSAPRVKYEMREQSVRISEDKVKNRSYLEDMYASEDNHNLYICQMCIKPLPYFEAVQIEKEPQLELKQMHMLLCPNCAAYYKGLRNDTSLTKDFISNLCDAEENQDEPVCVSMGTNTIKFTATHIAEIKEIQRLNALSNVNDEPNITSNV